MSILAFYWTIWKDPILTLFWLICHLVGGHCLVDFKIVWSVSERWILIIVDFYLSIPLFSRLYYYLGSLMVGHDELLKLFVVHVLNIRTDEDKE